MTYTGFAVIPIIGNWRWCRCNIDRLRRISDDRSGDGCRPGNRRRGSGRLRGRRGIGSYDYLTGIRLNDADRGINIGSPVLFGPKIAVGVNIDYIRV